MKKFTEIYRNLPRPCVASVVCGSPHAEQLGLSPGVPAATHALSFRRCSVLSVLMWSPLSVRWWSHTGHARWEREALELFQVRTLVVNRALSSSSCC
eukprot:33289-Pyramimonas_sp.AAC.1